jgi:hypothetical protein
MANRARNYMDRLLGRNESSESRDFTDGRRYGYRNYNPNGTTRSFDYNVRERDDDFNDHETYWNENFTSERDRTPRRFQGTAMRSEGRSGIFNRDRQESRGGFFGKGPKNWKRSDERIKEDVSESLYRDYDIDASEIEVDVKDGVVTLSGTVEDRQSKRAAEECIENLSGVVDVHNRLRIAERGNVSQIRSNEDENDKRALS